MARPALSARRTVVLVHGTLCSGRMWAPVAAAMGDGYDVRMPDLVGAGNAPAWHGERPFRLSDDARRVTAAITDVNGTFDLVGHSYGGAVALKLAMEIPGRVRNLVLIEPSWFTFLSGLGPKAAAARSEIGDIATTVAQTLVTGDTRSGVKRFLDFWNGPGSWERLPEERRAAFNARMHQVTMNFSAIYSENLSLSDLRRVAVPTQVMVGDRSPLPSRLVAGAIADALPVASLLGLGGVGHMSPITHPDRIARELMDYLDAALPPAAGTKGRQGAPRSIGRAVENPRAA